MTATRDAVTHLHPTTEEVRITRAIVDADAKLRDLNFNKMPEVKGSTVKARSITLCDPNRANADAEKVVQRICEGTT